MFLFLFDLVVGLLYFDVESLFVNVNRLKTHSNCTVPCLRKYSDDPGIYRLVKGNIYFFIGIVAGLISFAPVDGFKRLAVEGGVYLDDCYPVCTIPSSLEDEFGPESGGL